MAKLHVRYMVGGRAPVQVDEILYRFEFPERPGALLNFLTHMGRHWNISLFHYRNHGAAYGRVLVGMQVPSGAVEFGLRGIGAGAIHQGDQDLGGDRIPVTAITGLGQGLAGVAVQEGLVHVVVEVLQQLVERHCVGSLRSLCGFIGPASPG
jgi:hypothetical protein